VQLAPSRLFQVVALPSLWRVDVVGLMYDGMYDGREGTLKVVTERVKDGSEEW